MAINNVYGDGSGNAVTGATAGANTIVHYYDKAGVKAANTKNIYAQWADRRSMPLNMGKTFKVSKWLHMYDNDRLDSAGNITALFNTNGYLSSRDITAVNTVLANTALGEGAGAVNKRSIKKVTIQTNFARYGEMLDYTDEATMFSEDLIQVHYREELGLEANRVAEDLIQKDMLATNTVLLSGTAVSMATIGTGLTANGVNDDSYRVSYDLIRKAAKKLTRNRAEKNTSIVTGSTKVDTRTVAPAFYAIVGPEVKFDLEGLTRGTGNETEFVFNPVYKYADASNLAEGEIGSMHDVRFIESETAMVYKGQGATIPTSYVGTLSNNGTKFDVFPILFPTKGSFATVGLKGNGKIKFNSQSPSKIELSNPYGTNGFFSYNMWYAGLILREERLLKVLVAASE